jgi:uncharacterized phage protein (TIGR02220 family)
LGSYAGIVQSILDEFFVKTAKGYEKEKCNSLIKEYKKNSNKNRKNGAKGGRPKKLKASEETQWVSSGKPVATQEEPKHNPNYELETKNYELETRNQELNINQQADSVIDYLNEKTNQKYRHSETSRKNIRARLKDFTLEDCFLVVDKKRQEWGGTDMAKFLRPETLFGNKFESYLNQPLSQRQQRDADVDDWVNGNMFSADVIDGECNHEPF